MTASKLREAATVLRERAEAAVESLHGSKSWHGIGTGYREPIKEHIALMSPLVALALADWLDATTTYLQPGMSIEDDLCLKHALAVADAILGDRS